MAGATPELGDEHVGGEGCWACLLHGGWAQASEVVSNGSDILPEHSSFQRRYGNVYFNKHSFLVFLWWCFFMLYFLDPKILCMDKMVCLPNAYVKALSPRVTIFGDRTFEEVMKVKWGHEGWALIQCDWCLCKKGKSDQGSKGAREKAMKGCSEKAPSISQAEGLRRNQTCSHLDLEIPASRTMRKLISV